MASVIRCATQGKYRVVGSDAHSMWQEGDDVGSYATAIEIVDRKAAEGMGYSSYSVYNDLGFRRYTKGLSTSVDRVLYENLFDR